MDDHLYKNHLSILKEELKIATGCTEPIAIALAAAKARDVLGRVPDKCIIGCSGNIIKNVKSVTVPNSGGLKGIEVAAILGIVGGDANADLDVLHAITPAQQDMTKELLAEGFCSCQVVENEAILYVSAKVVSGKDSAQVEIKDRHNHISRITKNEEVIYQDEGDLLERSQAQDKRQLLNLRNIIEFTEEAQQSDLAAALNKQIDYNSRIAEEGLSKKWGASIGKTLMERQVPISVNLQARAYAAAGSDARMAGCSLPVVINSGSGNQGITVSLPIIIYAKELGADEELRLRALALANLIAIHQKKYIGNLSAFCGAVSAAAGAACGIAYMILKLYPRKMDLYQVISDTITNTICTSGGMICDGAKSSCAAKIATALESALTALEMSLKGNAFQPGDGLTKENIEETILTMGKVAAIGMRETDRQVLSLMMDQE
ncbi:L-cysteine desulfidase family protein [Murdochiella massiliensis]|uniref:L-cysteine desulfidase family protein n=1 Tax=Murdochiella massiliensis TaxID=1673723 RepID=UPI00082CB2ED|nr:L-serine ammonia-lyase, iron-sulfur-dependent, subunit alpha [Murdochiella massiliensis]